MASLSGENYNPEEYLLDTLNDLDIGFVKVSNDGTILIHNLTFNKIFGYNPEESLIGTKTLDYWLNLGENNKFIEILFKNGIVKNYIAPAKNVDGEKFFLELNFKLNKNSNGEIISSEGTIVDVTERIETEQKLKESEKKLRDLNQKLEQKVEERTKKLKESEQILKASEKKYRMLVENALEGIWVIDENSITSFANPRMAEMLGYSKDEMLGKELFDFMDERGISIAKRNVERRKQGVKEQHDFEFIRKNGTRIYTSLETSPITDEEGNYRGAIAFVADITERKKAEEKIKESEKRLLDLIEAVPIGISISNPEGKFTECNSEAYKISGFASKEEFLNTLAIDHYHDSKDRTRFVELHEKGLVKNFEVKLKRKDGTTYWSSITSTEQKIGNQISYINTFQDITERKKAEEELKSRYEFERLISLISIDFINVLDENLNDLINIALKKIGQFVNAVRCSLFIYSEDLTRVTNTNEWCVDPKDSQIDLLQNIPSEKFGYYFKLLKEKKDVITNCFDDIPLEASGEREWVKEHGFRSSMFVPMLYKNKIFGTLGFYGEINVEKEWSKDMINLLHVLANIFVNSIVSKQSEEKLKESEKKYRNIIENTKDGIVIIGLDGKFKFISPQLSNILGGRETTLGTEWFSNVHPDDIDNIGDFFSKAVKRKDILTTEEVEFRTLHNDGHYIWLSSSSKNYYDENGNMIGFITLLRDITEHKKKEKEIFDLAQFPSENPYPVLRVNRSEIIYINEAGQKLLNVVEHSQIPEFFHENVRNTFENNQITESEIEFDSKVYSFIITSVKDADYVNIYGMDITERKHVEEKLKEVNKLKSEFLRRASHELKTPLISIKGFSDLILSLYADHLDPVIISKVREINDGCERLQSIINNLLKTSQLESPELKPIVQKEDLSFLIKFCVHELESLAERRNQSIKLDIHSELYANIEKEEIHDVLSNLITNAIKYTPPNGKIEIKTDLKEDYVVVSVKDNGIGFTEEQKTKIFQQFGKIERYGQGLDLGIDGTGLGLYISKRIAEAHGGKIWMESEGKSRGSTFYFTLPTAK